MGGCTSCTETNNSSVRKTEGSPTRERQKSEPAECPGKQPDVAAEPQELKADIKPAGDNAAESKPSSTVPSKPLENPEPKHNEAQGKNSPELRMGKSQSSATAENLANDLPKLKPATSLPPIQNRIMDMSDDDYPGYEVKCMIGRGAYAKVYKAVHKATKTVVAIKHQFDVFEDLVTAKRVLREICILREIRHPSVVRLFDVFIPGGTKPTFSSLCLVFELAVTSMDKLIQSGMLLKPDQIQSLMYNTLAGLHHIHSAGVLHRDLKPGNILLYNDCSVRVCDFGLARTVPLSARRCSISASPGRGNRRANMLEQLAQKTTEQVKEQKPPKSPEIKRLGDANKKLTMHVATRWYRAPEIIIQQETYGPEVDVWAIGCIFAELLSIMKGTVDSPNKRKPLFPGNSCLGFSPRTTSSSSEKEETTSDQLAVILRVLGTPTEEDVSLIKDKEVADFVKGLPQFARRRFSEMYPKAEPEALDLLEKMLVFNPMKRIKVMDCLNHPYFASIRDKSKESTAACRLVLAVDKVPETDHDKILALFHKEISYYDKLRAEGDLFKDDKEDDEQLYATCLIALTE